jgi:hypothetical protein
MPDAPIEAEFRAKMNELAIYIDKLFNGEKVGAAREVGFVLLVSKFGNNKRCNYLSNCERADTIAMMKETAARLSGQSHKPGRA